MAQIDANGNVIRCYNSQSGSSVAPCGFDVYGVPNPADPGSYPGYSIFAPFAVGDRFISVTMDGSAGSVRTGANIGTAGDIIAVFTFATNNGALVKTGFTLIIF